MPKSPAVRISGARTRYTHWSKGSSSLSVSSLGTRGEDEAGKMQSNGLASANGKPLYFENYDGSGDDSSTASSAQYPTSKPLPPAPLNGQAHGGHYDDFDFSPSFDEPQARENSGRFDDFSFQSPMVDDIRLDTRQEDGQDAVGRHLLYETALLDTQAYEILDIDEVDELKKEHTRLHSRIEAANRKLALESKVKDAAQNLHRLYSATKKDGRPDTPQSPNDLRHGRNSLLGGRGRNGSGSSHGGDTLHQAEDELAQSIKSVDDLNEQIKTLLERRQTVEGKLLRHTAAVLAQQASQAVNNGAVRPTNGLRHLSSDDAIGYAPDDFDGIRDILRGVPSITTRHVGGKKGQDDHEKYMVDTQNRLEQLNTQLRGVITEASRSRGEQPAPEPQPKQSDDVKDRIESMFEALESNVRAVEQEQKHSASQHGIEERVGDLNTQLYNVMLTSPDLDMLKGLREPPKVTRNDHEPQLQYLEESLHTMEKVLRQHREDLQSAKETSGGATRAIDAAQTQASAQAQKAAELETVIAGLWELVASERLVDNEASSPVTPIREDFSLQAFSSRVQHLLNVAKGAKEQQDILRRQIQQQRDLNGKSDVEKDRELEELQNRFDQLTAAYDATQVDLATSMASNEQAEREVNESRGEMQNVMNELEQMRKTYDEYQTKQKDHDSRNAQLSEDKSTAEQAHADLRSELENLESEVVRLTTELTMAKADLDGAYGTRQERKKEAGVAAQDMEALEKLKDQEIEALRKNQADRTKLLETELQDMMEEFQAMTRESLELEKERGQLEGLIDGLREKVDQLEQQLADERVQAIGVKTPGGNLDPAPKESTSVMVLRQEFKRMMREARGEGIRALRTEQEERRKVEADLRRHRQAAGPLGRQGLVAAPSPRSAHSRNGTLASNSGNRDSAQTLTPVSNLSTAPQSATAG